jgi:hypothetical protein
MIEPIQFGLGVVTVILVLWINFRSTVQRINTFLKDSKERRVPEKDNSLLEERKKSARILIGFVIICGLLELFK